MNAKEQLHDGDRAELADDSEATQPEEMAQIDASTKGDAMHGVSLHVRTNPINYLEKI
ncbi:hypothetical protein [Paraburkholderia sp.]|uniref:hypothetical protein n=1 Tax=Paraburkholderia sp. TaxID=1926495 RepID=UPI0025E6CD8A|nr:hypothetical protein [Paraburkholderia sp.]